MHSSFAFETVTVAGTAIGLTSATFMSGVPAEYAVLGPLESGQIRWRADGTDATATVGALLEVGDTLVLDGLDSLALFTAIRTGGVSGALPVHYFR